MTGKIDAQIEEILETILPEAFAVVKETARRWAENGQLEVTAQDFDIELSQQKDGITIDNGIKLSGITHGRLLVRKFRGTWFTMTFS